MESRTAKAGRSLWQPITEDVFRTRLIQLTNKSNQVPLDPIYQQIPPELSEDKLFRFEITIARAFVFVAAADEGVDCVSAACVEGVQGSDSVSIRVASNAGVGMRVRQHLETIVAHLGRIAKKDESIDRIRLNILGEVVTLNKPRLHARLKSCKWKQPAYFHGAGAESFPLWQNLLRLSEEIKSTKSVSVSTFATKLRDLALRLKELYKGFTTGSDELALLQQIVQTSYRFCSSDDQMSFGDTLLQVGLCRLLRNKHVRQLEKVAAYFEVTNSIVSAARKYPKKFRMAKVAYVKHYAPTRSAVSSKGGRVSCHIHAEVQLLFFYELQTTASDHLPRVIGTSKAACFLCAQVIRLHGGFLIETAHLRIYDQWTLPDLAHFNDTQLARYRKVISQMYKELGQLLAHQHTRKPFPLTSWLDLSGKPPFSGSPSNRTVSVLPTPTGPSANPSGVLLEALLSMKPSDSTSESNTVLGRSSTLEVAGVDDGGRKSLGSEVHSIQQHSTVAKGFWNDRLSIEVFGSIDPDVVMKLVAIEQSMKSIEIEDTKTRVDLEQLQPGQEIDVELNWDKSGQSLATIQLSQKYCNGDEVYWKLLLTKTK